MADAPDKILLQGGADFAQAKAEIAAARQTVETETRRMQDALNSLSAGNGRGLELAGFYKSMGLSDAEAIAAAQEQLTAEILGGSESMQRASASAASLRTSYDDLAAGIARARTQASQTGGDIDWTGGASKARAAGSAAGNEYINGFSGAASGAGVSPGGDTTQFDYITGGYKRIADASLDAQHGSRAFIQVLRRVNPEMAEILALTKDVSEAWKLLFNPTVLAATAAAAGVAALVKQIERLIEEGKRAKETWEAVQKAEEAFRNQQRGQEEGAVKALAKVGITDQDRVQQGQRAVDKAVAAGISRESATAALPLAFDKNGQYVGDERFRDLAGWNELQGGALNADTAKARRESLREFDRAARRDPNLVGSNRAYYAGRENRLAQDMQQGNVEAIAQALAERNQLPKEQAEAWAKDVRSIKETNLIDFTRDQSGKELDLQWEGVQVEQLARQRRAAQYARSLGLISPEQFQRANSAQFGRDWKGEGGVLGWGDQRLSLPDAKPAAAPAGEPSGSGGFIRLDPEVLATFKRIEEHVSTTADHTGKTARQDPPSLAVNVQGGGGVVGSSSARRATR